MSEITKYEVSEVERRHNEVMGELAEELAKANDKFLADLADEILGRMPEPEPLVVAAQEVMEKQEAGEL